jgi:putative hemolysin
MHTVLALAVLAALAGCTGPAPEIIESDESFVTVSHPKRTKESAAKAVASAYCQERGERAAFLTDVCPEPKCAQRTITYWCW